MVKRIKVSRQGFTRCPGCSSHIKVADPLNETVCPFCSAALVDAVAEGPFQGALRSASRALMTGRSGLIAASLLGATTIGACSSDVDGGAVETDAVVDTASEDASGASDTNEAFDVTGEEDADASPIAPLYGAVPVDAGESADATEPADVPAVEDTGVLDAGPADVEADVADTPQVQPLYGAVPVDAGSFHDVEADASDALIVVPLYGAVPVDAFQSDDTGVEDTSPTDVTAEKDTGEPPIQPLYGAVPIDAFTFPEDVSSSDDAADSEEVTDPPVQPLYGAIPSDGE